jgi:hypothetical protein
VQTPPVAETQAVRVLATHSKSDRASWRRTYVITDTHHDDCLPAPVGPTPNPRAAPRPPTPATPASPGTPKGPKPVRRKASAMTRSLPSGPSHDGPSHAI